MRPDRRAKRNLVKSRLAHSNILAILLQEAGEKLLRLRENVYLRGVRFGKSDILKKKLMASGSDEEKQARILDFWFGELREGEVPPPELSRMWWAKDQKTDDYIRNNFESPLINAREDRLREWEKTPRGTLALIILLDQFSRNILRDTPGAFSQDPQALGKAAKGIEKGFDKVLHPVMRVFFYMPFMHSENLEMQERSIELFGAMEREFTSPPELAKMLSSNRDYAERHYAIIKRFGRYPHRNVILGRESSPEELEFLNEPGSSF
jgi:uncharacterized protein (DUF924 family)